MSTSKLYSTVDAAAPALARLLGHDGSERPAVLIITHLNPDGDAIGSLTGLGLALESLGHPVTMLAPTAVPPFVSGMSAVDRVQVFTEDQRLSPEIECVILVDTGDLQRIGQVWEDARAFLQARPLAVIDHHVTNSGEGVVNLVDPARSSTCELVFELLRAWGAPISPEVATALMLGVVTDTQSFRTTNTSPSALRVAAELLEAGADRERIVQEVYRSTPVATARLLALALQVMSHDEQIVWTHVSNEMQTISGAGDEAHGEVTDYLASLGGFRASVLFRERRDGGSVKVSLRSRPGVDVSVVAQQFGGGGHRQAAGCTIPGSLAEAETLLLDVLRARLAT
jgi:bifunctional oligoribonuclease and PAP phosphatase NrnA